jgi:RNA polymerase sigma-70 factor (ECF subfamily)
LQDADAADLVQDVFTTLVQELPSFRYDPSKSFRAWLKTVTLNRWRARWRRLPLLSLDSQAEPEGPDPLVDIHEAEQHGQLCARALDLMRTEFEERTWRALWLTAVEQKPAAQAAAELGMTVGAVYAARCRVLARLRKELEGLLD